MIYEGVGRQTRAACVRHACPYQVSSLRYTCVVHKGDGPQGGWTPADEDTGKCFETDKSLNPKGPRGLYISDGTHCKILKCEGRERHSFYFAASAYHSIRDVI